MVNLSPRLSSKAPMEEAETPLPREETTPPVTKTFFVRSLVLVPVIPCFCVITPRAVAEYGALCERKLRVSNIEKKAAKNVISFLGGINFMFGRSALRIAMDWICGGARGLNFRFGVGKCR